MEIAIFRKAHFNAAHRLYVPSWSDEKNFEVFGKCANPNFHGHNYVIEVKVIGEVDPVTGMLIDLLELKHLIKQHIEDKFDHKNLNIEIEEFQTMTPTVENICYLSWQILREHLDDRYDLKVRLYETPRNFAEYPPR
ncbi:MAG: 6-carboxytetrahydropterin synthase [Saprospiraceae bacterium]|nr:6-carboxytetrahydropterin synthase [Saprospiraceae bacterium]